MKKINQIIAYTLLGVVLLGLVLTAILKKDFSPNIDLSKGQVFIEQAGSGAKYDGLTSKDEKVYNEFVKTYNNSFKLTVLYSIFSGRISRQQEIENYGKDAPTFSNGFVITINFGEAQTLKSNGKVYYESTNSDTETLYKKVFFVVENGKGLTTKYIYFYCDANSRYYRLRTLANYDDLYKFISEMDMFKTAE